MCFESARGSPVLVCVSRLDTPAPIGTIFYPTRGRSRAWFCSASGGNRRLFSKIDAIPDGHRLSNPAKESPGQDRRASTGWLTPRRRHLSATSGWVYLATSATDRWPISSSISRTKTNPPTKWISSYTFRLTQARDLMHILPIPVSNGSHPQPYRKPPL
jgi:hypothetical protein